MHKHFRMISISEHLRNHGFDPDVYRHTRIPHIWAKLRTYYNLDLIDERESFDEDEADDKYVDFSLPQEEFMESMMQRALADPSEAPTSPPELNLSPPSSPPRKRARRDTVSKTRATSAADTEEGTDAQSPPARSTRRGSRGRTRAASQAKADKAETTEEEEQAEDGAESESEGEEEEKEEEEAEGEEEEDEKQGEAEGSAEESGTPVSRSTRRGERGRPQAPAKNRRSRRG